MKRLWSLFPKTFQFSTKMPFTELIFAKINSWGRPPEHPPPPPPPPPPHTHTHTHTHTHASPAPAAWGAVPHPPYPSPSSASHRFAPSCPTQKNSSKKRKHNDINLWLKPRLHVTNPTHKNYLWVCWHISIAQSWGWKKNPFITFFKWAF